MVARTKIKGKNTFGHAKHGGQLGRSRMKKDGNAKSSGFATLTEFNLRKILHKLPKTYGSED